MHETVILHTAPLAQCLAAAEEMGLAANRRVLVTCRELRESELAKLAGWQVIQFIVPGGRWQRRYARLFLAKVGGAERIVAPYSGQGYPDWQFANVCRFLYLLGDSTWIIDRDGQLAQVTWLSWWRQGMLNGLIDRAVAGTMLLCGLLLMALADFWGERT